MDETPPQVVSPRPLTRPENVDGLADRVAAVEAAREQFGHELDRFTAQTRAQMGQTVEKLAWKLAVAGVAVATGVVVRQVLIAGWRATTKTDPPSDPNDPSRSWTEAVAWAAATGAGTAVVKLVATRGAAAGWQRATGHAPPGLQRAA